MKSLAIPEPELHHRLIEVARKRNREQFKNFEFSTNMKANALIKDISRYPHAYLIALIMNSSMPFMRAYDIPFYLRRRIGGFSFRRLRVLTQKEIVRAMTMPSSLHRYSQAMSKNLYRAIRILEEKYFGDASRIWADRPSSAEIVFRLLEFPGIGQKKATLGANDLARVFKIPMKDKSSIDISLDVHVHR